MKDWNLAWEEILEENKEEGTDHQNKGEMEIKRRERTKNEYSIAH